MNRPRVGAFTLVELLVVLAVVALGALLLAPVLARTQPDARSARCLNNHRQLTRAWLMYANDFNDKLVGVAHSPAVVANPPQAVWAQGWLDWSISAVNTNTTVLTDPIYSGLATYAARDARIFKCPSDRYVSPLQQSRGWRERARSIAANQYAASGDNSGGPTDATFAQVTKLTGLLNPKPAETWVFIDENADSINDGVLYPPNTTKWIDLPASYHDGGAGVAFGDGHVELHRWQASLLNVPIKFSYAAPTVMPNDADVLWLRYHTPRQPGMN